MDSILADGKRKVLKTVASTPLYLPTGHLIYVSKGTLFAVRFDPGKLETIGEAVPILEDVQFQAQSGSADVSVSRTGTLVYRKGGASGPGGPTQTKVEWIDATGKRSPLTAKPGAYVDLRVSPDGSLLALVVNQGNILDRDIWVYDPKTEVMRKLTSGLTGYDLSPVWTPDGRYIFHVGGDIFRTRADGGGQPQRLLQETKRQDRLSRGGFSSISPDGKRLAGFGGVPSTQIFTIPLTEENGQLKAGEWERFFESPADAGMPMFSPDGKWIAYVSNKSGTQEVNVRAYPATTQSGEWQISNAGGIDPHWSRNGRDLLYREGDRIMAVPYTASGDAFNPGRRRVYVEKLGGTRWDLAKDGRIAVLTPVETAQAPAAEHTVAFLENFFDEVRRRVK